MKKIIDIYKNWRADMVMLTGFAAAILLCCEAEIVATLLLTKVAGVALGLASVQMFRHWSKQGLINEMENFINEEG